MITSLPLVSLLVIARNEKQYLRRCVDSLLRQDYPREQLEFVFVDGCSEDGTAAFLEREVSELSRHGYAARLLVNRKRILASGWNLGIQDARGQFVCRVDAHSEIGPSYISSGVQCLLQLGNERIAAVGGWLAHVGTTLIGRSIAALLSARFAVGDSPFRQRPVALCRTDTAVFAVYRRSVFSEVGYFDENLARNQDMVMHHRLKAAGYTLLTHPDMEITYYVRSTVRRLMKKAFGDGKWVARAGGEHFCLRHKVPFLFVLYLSVLLMVIAASNLLLSSLLGQVLILLAWLPILGYGVMAVASALKASGPLHMRLLLVPLFFVFHVAYGMGTLWGYCQMLLRRSASEAKPQCETAR